MKIAFVVPEISKTGGMRIIFEYANRLVKRGYNVSLISPIVPFNSYIGEFSPYFLKYRLKYAIRFLTGKIEKPQEYFDMNFKINYIPFPSKIFVPDADIYIATSWTSSYLVDSINKGKKFYLVQDYEVWTSNKKFVDNSYKLNLQKIVVSTYLQNLLKEKFAENSEVVLNGIDFKKFNNPEKKLFKVNSVLFMDHLLENKNVKDALLVINKLHTDYPEIKIDCFGRRKYSDIPGYVKFTENPSDEEIANLYRSSDIFLYTSLNEGFALPPAEAMACKCAVAGYNNAGLPDYSINETTALLCETGNVETLYENVRRLINDSKLLESISLGGYNHIRKTLAWDEAVNKFEKIILS